MIPNYPDGETEESCVEAAQKLYDHLKEKGFSGEILNNAHQLVKKVQSESKELNNVDDRTEEPADENDAEELDSEHLDKDSEHLDAIEEEVSEMQDEDEAEEDPNAPDVDMDEDDMPDYSKMSKDEMGKDLKQRGIIKITIM